MPERTKTLVRIVAPRWRPHGRAGAAGLVAVALACGCGRAQTALRSRQAQGANVLLVTIDTLRRDRLGAYGNTSGLTPTLDRLAGDGIRYGRAFSHVPMTLPAHTSILTGLTPRRHGVRNNVSFRLSDDVPTLATELKSAGYRTGAFVGAFVLDARFGLNRGFDDYDDRYPQGTGATFHFAERRASDVVKAAGDWILGEARAPAGGDTGARIAAGGEKWFAWVHLFDPHAPYDAPPEYRGNRTPYDAEVAYADAMLGQLLDRLRSAHALDRTLIVFTADHGESLGEHGEKTHGLFAYDATILVPLVLSGPAIGPAVVDAPVGHADIMPTVLDLVGVRVPPGLDGQSLVRTPERNRALYFEALDASLTRGWAPLTGVVRGGWKYIDLPVPELYDLERDPPEALNLAGRETARREAFARALAPPTPASSRAATPAIDEEAAARLRALGYVGTLAPSRTRRYTERDDPKTLVGLNERFNDALELFNEGRADQALGAFRSLLGERPDFNAARTSAATALLSLGRAADAVALLQEAPAEQAAAPDILAKLGAALRDAGDLTGALAAFQRARDAGNQNPDLFNDLGVVYARLGRAAEARRMFDELLRRNPQAPGTWYNVGILDMSAGNPEAAAKAFERAVNGDPSYGDAWQGLGAALVDRDRAAAIDAWTRAERLLPGDYDLLFNLGMVLADSNKPSEAIPYLQRFIREAPRDRYARDIPRVQAILSRLERGRL